MSAIEVAGVRKVILPRTIKVEAHSDESMVEEAGARLARR